MIAELALAGWVLAAVVAQRALAGRERMARASHEVRGPLTAAGLALQMMARGGEAPPERLVALEEQLRRARLALEDLDDRHGCAGDKLQRLSVARLLASLHVAWAPVCAAQGRPLVVGTAPPGLSVLADGTRLAQALGNLIANALEHGEGAIEVRPRVAGTQLRLEVRDGGAGLGRPLDEILRGAWGGIGRRGRGLAIAAGIARRHGGSVSTAPSAEGASLVLALPLLGVLGAVEEQAAR